MYMGLWLFYIGDNVTACGDGRTSKLMTSAGTLNSPGYDKNTYPNNAVCRWLISAPLGKVWVLCYYVSSISITYSSHKWQFSLLQYFFSFLKHILTVLLSAAYDVINRDNTWYVHWHVVRCSTHTQQIWRQKLRCCRTTCLEHWNNLPSHLCDEYISYNSFRHEIKTYSF